MDVIDATTLGTIDGFDISAHIVPDLDATVSDSDCYNATQREAWRNDAWHFVGIIVTASRADVDLGSASLWGCEYGLLPGVEGWVSPLDNQGSDAFANGYGPQLIAEAIAEARATLEKINNV